MVAEARFVAAAVLLFGVTNLDALAAFPSKSWWTLSQSGKWHREHDFGGNTDQRSLKWAQDAMESNIKIGTDGLTVLPVRGLYYQYGSNTTEATRGVNCTYEHVAPCYIGLTAETQYVLIWSNVWPLLPWLASFCFLGRTDCGNRLCYYISCMLVFSVYFYPKAYLTSRPWYIDIFGYFDPSDHITDALVSLLIAFEEVYLAEDQFGENRVVPAAAITVLLAKMYESYFTCLYFHTPLESLLGYFFGLFIVIFLYQKVRPIFIQDEDEYFYFSKAREPQPEMKEPFLQVA